MASSKSTVLKLYKTMMREAFQFQSYNYRMYTLRRIRDGFRGNMNVSDKSEIDKLVNYARDNLEIIKRQTVIGNLYSTDQLIIEKCQKKDEKKQSPSYSHV